MKGKLRLLAVASAGGHFVQLCRLIPAWAGCEVAVVTTDAGLHSEVEAAAREAGLATPDFKVVVDVNRWHKLRVVRALIEMAVIFVQVRPDVVITTGAAPGYLALRLAALFGIRTIWIDSIANTDELSMSGTKAGAFADLWLTQWEHLAGPDGPYFRGSVL